MFVLLIWTTVLIAWGFARVFKTHPQGLDKLSLIWCMVLSVAFIAIFAPSFYQKTIDYFSLKGLESSEVISVKIGSKTWDKPEDIKKIVQALNQVKWYTVNHDMPHPLVPMSIKLNSSSNINLEIGRYAHREGAVVFFSKSYNPMFIPDIPTLLASLGYSL